jgi:hypothetical protein
MVVIPPATPVTNPVRVPTTATAVFPLDQNPPEAGLVKVIDAPAHTRVGPDMPRGGRFTVTILVAIQPAPVE